MDRPSATAWLLGGSIAMASGALPAQTPPREADANVARLPYADIVAVERLPYDPAISFEPLSYDLEPLSSDMASFNPGADEGALTVLGVAINGRELDDTTVMTVRGGVAMVPIDDLHRWRLHSSGSGVTDVDGQPYAPLGSVSGLAYKVDDVRQMLVIDAPGGAFESTTLSAGVAPPSASPAARTAFLNYDVSLEHSGGNSIAAGFIEMGASDERGLLTNTMLASSDRNRGVVRFDTYAIRDDPGGLTRLMIGDGLTRGSSWSPQTRFGGIRYGTDFTLQPGFLSFPTPTFNGQAALPSNVEVYVNNVLRYQTQVDQGPFALNQLPLLAGSGQVSLRVKDALGVERAVLSDYYVSTRLLRAGLAEYSVELGAERQRYGLKSFDYGRPFLSATHRYGLSGRLTSEARAEIAQDLQMIGGGLATTVGQLGEIGFAVAASRSADGTGTLYRGFASRVSRTWSVSASYQSASRDFIGLGRVGQGDRPRSTLQAGGGITFGRWGSLNASEAMITRINGTKSRITTMNYNRRIGRLGNFTAFAVDSRSTDTPSATTVGVSFSMALRSNTNLYAQADTESRRLELQKSLPTDKGFGYRLVAEQGVRDQQEVDLSYRNSLFDFSSQAVRASGSISARGLFSGGLLLAGGDVFPTRRLDSGFAIVEVKDQPGIRVFQDNREVGRTNDRGLAIVTQLRPYEANRIAVAPDDLHLDTTIATDTLAVVPRFLSGVYARFGVGEGHAGTILIHTPDDKPILPGTTIDVAGGRGSTLAGMDGEVFIEDIAGGMTLVASTPDGPCAVTVPPIPAGETLPRLGPVLCARETR